MKIVIMAGGLGTRMGMLSQDTPKPMLTVCGKPVLEHQLSVLSSQGFRDIIISTGYLGQAIKDYFGNGSGFGVRIDYFHEDDPLGTAGALIALKPELGDDFLVINGDIIFDIDFSRLICAHNENDALATLVSHPNGHPYDSSLIEADENGRVICWYSKEDHGKVCKNRVNAGIHLLSSKVLENFCEVKKTDLDRDILKPLISTGRVYAYDTPEYICDMGTPERYKEVERDVRTGKVAARNLKNKQSAVFLDRDGVINVYKGFLSNTDQVELLPGAAQAIRMINKSRRLAIVITNQPVIARGECTWEELKQIHNTIETLLGKEGAYIDDIYICPHHPDKGFDGERPEYKIDCECRKPKPGLIFKASEKYNIDLSRSYMAGDDTRDIMAGIAAGCQTVLIGKEYPGCRADQTRLSLLEFVESVPELKEN